jgi:secreted trypsin-like serine protease
MFAVLLIQSVGLLIFASAQDNNCGISGQPSGLIVNGTQSDQGQWPWLVAIYKIQGNQFICGGTLISADSIITVKSMLALIIFY